MATQYAKEIKEDGHENSSKWLLDDIVKAKAELSEIERRLSDVVEMYSILAEAHHANMRGRGNFHHIGEFSECNQDTCCIAREKIAALKASAQAQTEEQNELSKYITELQQDRDQVYIAYRDVIERLTAIQYNQSPLEEEQKS